MVRRLAAVLCAVVGLSACNPAASLRDPAVDAEIRTTFDRARLQDPRFMQAFTPELASTVTPQAMAQVHAEIPPGAPRSRRIVATHVVKGPTWSAIVGVDEYDFGDRKLMVETRLEQGSGTWRVGGFHVQSATVAEIQANRFVAPGKSLRQYLFLAFVIMSPLLMIAALVKVIRTKGLRRRWLWGVLAFVGLTQMQMNWTTGVVSVNFPTIQLIGAMAAKGVSSLAPWLLTATLPIGAVLILAGFWANPKRARAKTHAAEASQ